MKTVKDQFDERKAEFRAYLRLLEHLDQRLLRHAKVRRRVGDLPTPDTFKAMKATAFLMVYNIIEATIVGSMAELYGSIKTEACTLPDVTLKIQELWIDQRFWIKPQEATPKTYRDRAEQMLRQTMNGAILSIDPRKLPLSGNIDADETRGLCDKHGVKLVVPKKARGGAELATVKIQRNALAHGDKTFVECGRDYSVADLARISQECFNFLGGFVRTLERFIKSRGYRRKDPVKPSSFRRGSATLEA
jgi:hypothetical protein